MQVMISYSHADWSEVEPVVSYLKHAGIELWIDREQIKPTMIWQRELLAAPRQTAAIICFLSENYLSSEICRMELFLTRKFDKPVFPVMLQECWDLLDRCEETKYLGSTLAARLQVNRVVGLTTTREEVPARLRRAVDRKLSPTTSDSKVYNLYMSYPDGAAEFATSVHNALDSSSVHPWIATVNCDVGDDWRRVQTRTMSAAKVNLIIMGEEFASEEWRTEVLRTETLLSEAFDHPTLCFMTPALSADTALRNRVFNRLSNGEQAFRRLKERQWFSPDHVAVELKEEVSRLVA